jgi:hypothetical protein
MRRVRLAVVSFGALLLFATQAGAAPNRQIVLNVNDTFAVAGTDIACGTQVGKNLLKGQKLFTCFKVKGNALAVGTYVSAIGVSGQVVIGQVKKDGSIGSPVFNRKPASLGANPPKQYTAHVGDALLLSGTDLACAIASDRAGIYPTCFRHTSKGGRPASYAFAETEKFVAVVQFDKSGTKSKLIFKRPQ